MPNFQHICQQFSQILNGKPNMKHGVCSVEKDRNLHVTIQSRPSRSKLIAEMSFESLDNDGNALNLGEVVVLEEEIPAFVNMLVRKNLIISAIHNHWIFTNPNIFYVHFQSVEHPLTFAHKVAEAFRVLKH